MEAIEFLEIVRTIDVDRATKVPKHTDWLKGARRRPRQTLELSLIGHMVGIPPTGGIVVVDIDPRNGGFETASFWGWIELREGQAPVQKWPPNVPRVRTPGGGVHLYFSHGQSLRKGTLSPRAFPGLPSTQEKTGIDIQAEGSQVVAPPSKNADGKAYVWEISPRHPSQLPPLPVFVLDALNKSREFEGQEKAQQAPGLHSLESKEDQGPYPRGLVLSALDYISPSSLSYEQWIGIGFALHNSGYSYDVWDMFSARDSARYTPSKNLAMWQGMKPSGKTTKFITLLAKDLGWKPDPALFPKEDFSFLDELMKEGTIPTTEESSVVPGAPSLPGAVAEESSVPPPVVDLVKLPVSSLFSRLLQALNDSSIEVQPDYAAATAVAFASWISFSHVSAAKIACPLSNYTVLVGGAGIGKGFFSNFAVKNFPIINSLLWAEEPSSSHGFSRMLNECNAKIIVKNEIATLLSAQNGDAVKEDLIGSLCSAWVGEHLLGKANKKKEETIKTVVEPLFCLFGGCTEEQLKDILNNKNFCKGGLFYRCDFIVAKANSISREPLDFPEDLAQLLLSKIDRTMKQLKAAQDKDLTSMGIWVSPKNSMTIEKAALARINKLRKECKEQAEKADKEGNIMLRELHRRIFEKVCRIATAIAFFEGETRAPVTLNMVEWAVAYQDKVRENIEEAIKIADEDTDHGKLCNSVLAAVRSLPKQMSLREIYHTNKGTIRGVKPQDMKLALQTLEIKGEISVEVMGKRTVITRLK